MANKHERLKALRKRLDNQYTGLTRAHVQELVDILIDEESAKENRDKFIAKLDEENYDAN